jgi:hypothetical protein
MTESYIELKVGSSKHFTEKDARSYEKVIREHPKYKDVKVIRDREGKTGYMVLFKKK